MALNRARYVKWIRLLVSTYDLTRFDRVKGGHWTTLSEVGLVSLVQQLLEPRICPQCKYLTKTSLNDKLGKGKITSFVLYLYTTFQPVSFLTKVDRRCPLLGILLQV
ncbi:hypothetical protein Hanom_Chr01g00036711 [Helianthus anomalus]